MKKLILITVSALVLGATSVTGLAAEKATKSASAPSSSQTQAAPSNTAQTAGRLVTDFFTLAGSALKWTGNAAKNVASSAGNAVTKLVNNLEQQQAKSKNQ